MRSLILNKINNIPITKHMVLSREIFRDFIAGDHQFSMMAFGEYIISPNDMGIYIIRCRKLSRRIFIREDEQEEYILLRDGSYLPFETYQSMKKNPSICDRCNGSGTFLDIVETHSPLEIKGDKAAFYQIQGTTRICDCFFGMQILYRKLLEKPTIK